MRKVLLSLVVGLAVVGSVAPALAADVHRTYVDGGYKYICTLSGDAEVCGNWNHVQ